MSYLYLLKDQPGVMGKIETIKKANIAVKMSVSYRDPYHGGSQAQIFLYSRDLLTNEIRKVH